MSAVKKIKLGEVYIRVGLTVERGWHCVLQKFR